MTGLISLIDPAYRNTINLRTQMITEAEAGVTISNLNWEGSENRSDRLVEKTEVNSK